MEIVSAPPASSSPYTPVGGQNNTPATNPAFNTPKLGAQVPGTTGGLPGGSGLSVFSNPAAPDFRSGFRPQLEAQGGGAQRAHMAPELSPQGAAPTTNPAAQSSAQHTQSFGRGNDTVLVHMTPEEVNSLRGLAQQFGGDLTTNPNTGLPEAGWLGKLLPTLIGGLGMAFGIPPVWMGALGAVGGTAITGDIKQGLMAGLGAYGGASLAGGLGLGSSLGNVGAGLPGATAATGATAGAAQTAMQQGAQQGAQQLATKGLGSAAQGLAQKAGAGLVGQAANAGMANAVNGIVNPGFLTQFGNAAQAGLPGGIIGKAAPMLAAQGVLGGLSGAMTSGIKDPQTGAIDNSYQGPYYAQQRQATFAPETADILNSSKERTYFDVSQPEIYNQMGQVVQPGSNTAPGTPIVQKVNLPNPKNKKGQPMYSFTTMPWMQDPNQQAEGYAEGGVVNMDEGGFVIPARAVADAGNGFTDAGFERFARLGGIPLRGKGDGVSDDIPARIGDQEARVAAGEVYMPPHAVERAGGAKKLYALVNKAHEARKRGQKSPVASGLDAL